MTVPSLMTRDMFRDIGAITRWLDTSNARMIPEHDDSMRVMKIGEEYGETLEAYEEYTAYSTGRHTSLTELFAELADVALTALCAIQHFTGDESLTRQVFTLRMSELFQTCGLAFVPTDDPTGDLFTEVAIFTAWMDTSTDVHIRSIGRANGKAVAAYIGYTGQNPRKGQTHTRAQLNDALCNVVIAALVTITNIAGDDASWSRKVMASKIQAIITRAGIADV